MHTNGHEWNCRSGIPAATGSSPSWERFSTATGWTLRATLQTVLMIKELDLVALTTDLPPHGLVAGDVGTVVMIHRKGEGYEVEFMTSDGETSAVLSLLANQVRPLAGHEVLHARELATVG
jgi:hypothetical protein